MKTSMKRVISIISCLCLIITGTMIVSYAEEEQINAAEGQYFDASDPRGIGIFSDEEISIGLDKADLSIKIATIKEKALKNPQSINSSDIAVIEEYIEKYNSDSEISDYIPYSINGIAARAVGDYESKNLNLPGQKQKYSNYCAPASIQAVLGGKGINVSQDTLASLCGITAGGQGTYLNKVAPALNRYNKNNGGSSHSFYYTTLLPENVAASAWNVTMSDCAIETIAGGYGVIYDVHQVKGSPNYLQGYETMVADDIYHYVAGEGFDATDPSRRICYYYDSNDQKTNLGNRHMHIPFATMGVLTNDMGLVY